MAGTSTGRFEDRKSVFTGFVTHVTSEEELVEFRHGVMRDIPEASHYVSAYVLHRGGLAHYSDAKEPHGTAGLPVLTVLQHHQLEDVGCVVARVFGGTLLGRGGLMRAYTAAAQRALEAARLMAAVPCVDVRARMGYPWYERVRALVEEQGAQVLDAQFAAQVELVFRVRAERCEAVLAQVGGLTAGQVAATPGAPRLQLVDDDERAGE